MIPNDLIKSIKDNNCIFFLGAGMSATSGIPMGYDLSLKLYKKYVNEHPNIRQEDSLTAIASKAKGSLACIKNDISRMLISQKNDIPTEYRLLTLLAKKYKLELYTLNYDMQLERSFDRMGLNLYNKYYYDDTSFCLDKTSVIKLAGDVLNAKSMLVNKEELQKINSSRAYEHFRDRISNGCKVVFIGYSMRDDVLATMFSDIKGDNAYFVGKDWDEPEGVYHISNTAQSFFCELIRRIGIQFKVAHIKFDGSSFGGIETYLAHIESLATKMKEDDEFVRTNQFENDYYNIYATARHIVGDKRNLGFPLIKGASAVTFFETATLKQYDLFHCHDFISAYHAQMAGFPVVFTSHSLGSKDSQNKFDLYNGKNEIARLEEQYYPMIHNIVTLSLSHKNELPSYSNLHAKKLTAPFDFDTLDAIASRIKKNDARNCIKKISEKDFVLLYIGRCDSRKGYHYVIEAFEKLKDNNPSIPIKLMLIMPGVKIQDDIIYITNGSTASGSAVPEPGITKFKTRYKGDIITDHEDWRYHKLKDHYEKLFIYYKAADIVLIPSLYEPFGYVALEALVCKCPIIANYVDGLAENLKHEKKELATFCQLGIKTNDIYASGALYDCIHSVINVKENMLTVDKEVERKAIDGYNYLKSMYSGKDASSKAISELYELYIQAIINSSEIPFIYDVRPSSSQVELCEDLYNIIFDYYLRDAHELTEIVKRSGFIYKDILYLQAKMALGANPKAIVEEPSGPIEIYGLFWGIAGKILNMKSLVKGIAMMNIRTLAETITETTRAQTDTLKSIFTIGVSWDDFLKLGIENLKDFYQNDENKKRLLSNSSSYTNYHTNYPERICYYVEGIKKDVIWNILNNMVKVEETDFMFGASETDNYAEDIEKGQKKVHLSPYFINKFPVTRREWNIIMSDETEPQYEEKDGNCPVYNVSYNDCVKFIKRLNSYCYMYNLRFDFPTEAQWECAAKCATDKYLYSGSDNIMEVGWFVGNADSPQPVGLLKENRWGLFDMSGNVQEFCKDVFSPLLPGGNNNPCNYGYNNKDHVTRGGSTAKQARACRITNRYDRYDEDFNCMGDSCFLGLRLTLQYW